MFIARQCITPKLHTDWDQCWVMGTKPNITPKLRTDGDQIIYLHTHTIRCVVLVLSPSPDIGPNQYVVLA